MAVVVSSSQNEVAEMKKKGVDIAPHRQKNSEGGSGHQIQRPG